MPNHGSRHLRSVRVKVTMHTEVMKDVKALQLMIVNVPCDKAYKILEKGKYSIMFE